MGELSTKHSIKRTKERLGISKKIAEKNAEKAWENGLAHSELKRDLKNFVDKHYLSNPAANNIKVYNHNVYIFCGQKLVTILNLPQSLCKQADQIKRKKGEATV